ncbi:MAG: glycosyltransferase, partial [Gammaproteobacteria bacterium]|nr:glycosyltransferase [Gammaproteobacteria bacterium]
MEAVIPDQTATAPPRTAAPAACPDDGAPPVDIIIPFYRRADLVAPLMDALSRMSAEIAACRGRVIVINDSPDDPALSAALDDVERRATGVPALSVRTNDRNLGFVGSVNHGLAAARDAGHDALLLNSDTRPSPGAFAEMRRVAYADAMTGFVSPRSNNATLCTLPPQAEYHRQSP